MSPRALAATLPKVTKPVLEKHGRAYAALIGEWHNIAGPSLAAMSLPEKLVTAGGRAAGTLTVRVAGAAATELQHLAPQVIERINTYLGFSAVTRLKLVQGPVPGARPAPKRRMREPSTQTKAAIETATSGIPDPDVRAALVRFGQSVASNAESETPGTASRPPKRA
jgi:hypothetical protein